MNDITKIILFLLLVIAFMAVGVYLAATFPGIAIALSVGGVFYISHALARWIFILLGIHTEDNGWD